MEKEIKAFSLNNKVRVVLTALMSGIPFEYEDRKWVMDEEYNLCVEAEKGKFEKGSWLKDGIIYLKVDFTLKEFINWISKIPNEEVFLLGCKKVLMEIHNKE
jgi:hypothetical protein